MACRRVFSNISIGKNINSMVIRRPLSATSIFLEKNKELAEVTHTGQVWDSKDYRNVRFTNATRYVNDNWGIKLIAEIPARECTERVVYCDGGDGPLGHPKVYINLDKPGEHSCGYCGLRFVKSGSHH